MQPSRSAILILWVALLTGAAASDVVVLHDGDTLSGTTVRVTESTLVFRTTLEGQFMAPLDAVAGLTTGNHLAMTLLDETVLYGRLVYRSGRQQYEPIGGGEVRPLALADIAEAAVIPPSRDREEAEDLDAWRAALGVGLRHRENDASRTVPEARLELGARLPRVELRADLRASDGDGGEGAARGAFEVEGRREGLAPYGAVAVEYDPDRGLDLRTDYTLGVVRPFLDEGTASLRAMAGLSLSREQWDNRALDGVTREEALDTDLNLRLQLSYAQPLGEDWEVRSMLDLLPSVSDWGEVRARSETELSYAVSPRLRLRLGLLLDYDSDPAVAGPSELGASVSTGFTMDF